MSGVIIPGVFAANDNVTIEGNLNPLNRSEELYVVKFDAVSKMTEVTFSIYSIDDYAQDTIFSSSSFVNSGGTFQNFYVKFFPPLFKDDMTYAIHVTGDGLLGRQLLTINSEFTSYNSEVEDDQSIHEQEYAKLIEEQEAEQRAAEQRAAEQRAAEQRAAEQRAAEAKAEQDRSNLLMLVVALVSISSIIAWIKRKNNKKSNNNKKSKNNKKSNNSSSGGQNKNNSRQIFCNNCGFRMLESTQFCNNCGKSSSDKKTYEDNYGSQSKNTLKDYYDILELDVNATPQEIKAARNRLTLQWHPDKHRSLDRKVMAENEIKKINNAYAELRKAGKTT